jgi:hypothetical protein
MVKPAILRVPTELSPFAAAPGCKEAPEFKVTVVRIAPSVVLEVPPPARVAPELMVNEPVPIAEPELFWRFNQPPFTVVPPVKVLTPESVSILVPVFAKAMFPWITPP